MKYALFWSGGKDSLLALDRARQQGLDVVILANIYEGGSERVRFHGARKEAVAAQAEALGIELLQRRTHPQDFEQTFRGTLEDLRRRGVDGVVFGNIHLADVRAWYEERTVAMGFTHVEPLWGDPPPALIREFVRRGHRARVVSVYLACGRAEWLGSEVNHDFVRALEASENVDVCGERGEYHTFAFDGPLFHRPLALQAGPTLEMENHLILDFSIGAVAAA